MRGAYLLALVMAISCLGLIDHRWKLAYFNKPQQTVKIMLVAILLFVVWDIAGIIGKIFFIGSTDLLIGLRIGDFPLEELFFLLLLNYSSLIIYLLVKKAPRS